MSSPISDYALIGDCETAALVSKAGCIDWLCWPAFDSEACFAALLGGEENGRWSLAPTAPVTGVTRRYRGDTLILETTMRTAQGVVVLTDFMPVRGRNSDLVRIVACTEGAVEIASSIALRFDYGRLSPWLTRRGGEVVAIVGPNAVEIRADRPLDIDAGDCVSRFTLRAGERASFTLTYFESHREAPQVASPDHLLQVTEAFWRDWSARQTYRGPQRDLVMRSLITLKALTYRPTGGLVAAVTSSLPETPGGDRNWDYRFCWLRDATFTLLTLLQAGYREEAAAWRDWLLRAVAGDPARLQPIYGISGQHRLMEWEAPWLAGFGGAKPVRFGNAAAAQRQLDGWGEVVDALYQAERHGVALDASGRTLQQALVERVETIWREPDSGIWEVRGPPQRFTHSQVMAWVAVDRGLKALHGHADQETLDRWRALRRQMHDEICQRAYDPELGAFTQAFGSKVLDASTLLLPHVGFIAADDPRMVGTVAAIERRLMRDGFVRRYEPLDTDDGLGSDEGVFLACSFWLVDNLVRQGRRADAEALFERLAGLANDVGLLSEEYDASSGMMLGNFPQALSHLSLVNTAFSLGGDGPVQERGRSGG